MDERVAIDRLIGSGGAGDVYEGRQRGVDRPVAVKTLRAAKLADREQVARFFREAKLMSTLNHPNIAKVYTLGVGIDGRPYFVLDYISGRPLSELIASGELQTEDDVVEVFAQILSGLQHAHEKGIVHRDLKPSNILIQKIDGKFSVHIVDFGIAHSIESASQALTRAGAVIGSPMYMSPEQCMGKHPDLRSDLYSVGCMMYEMVSGKPPFECDEAAGLLRAHVMEQVPSLKKTASFKVSARLVRIIHNALLKDPNSRYQSAQAMLQDLERLRLGKSIVSSGAQEKRVLSPQKKRFCTKLFSVFIGILVVASALALISYNKNQKAAREIALDHVEVLVQRGETKAFLRHFTEANSLLNEAYEEYIALGAPDKKRLAEMLHDRGIVSMWLRRKDEACMYLKKSLVVYHDYCPEDEDGINTVRYDYTSALMRNFKYQEAVPELEKLAQFYEAHHATKNQAITLERLVYAYESGQRFQDAAVLYNKLTKAESEYGVQSDRLAVLARDYAAVLRRCGRISEAAYQLSLADELDRKAESE
ncbi:MAG TPA: serine/threonine-protein kinase [Candidatus Obscuribacterales bacterium]